MKRILVGMVVTAIVMGAMVLAEEAAINPIRVTTRQINAYGPNPIQIMGTNVSVSAAQINAAGGGTTATITPTTATVSGTLTASGKFVMTPTTATLTLGNSVLTPAYPLYYIAGQYGVCTVSLAAATSPGMPLTIINTVATNVVYPASTGLVLPTGYTAWTNGANDSIRFISVSTNWICTGTQDN